VQRPDRPIEIRLRLPGSRRAPAHARAAIDVVAPALLTDVAERARLLVSELVTNSVRHADLSSDERIEVRIALDRRLRVEVRDRGRGFRWQQVFRPHRTLGSGGLGLLMLGELASSWGVETGPPTLVWFEIERPDVRFADPVARVTRRANPEEGSRMGEKQDEMKGRAKEAAGALTDDDELKREGKLDQAGAAVKRKTNEAVDATKDALDGDR